jgi:hypothetical protein
MTHKFDNLPCAFACACARVRVCACVRVCVERDSKLKGKGARECSWPFTLI